MPRRPPDFEGFVGQRALVGTVEKLVRGALAEGRPVPHFLFSGPPGQGKSLLSDSIGSLVGCAVHSMSASLLDPKALCRTLHECAEGDVIFLDEVHVLRPKVLMLLHDAVDNHRVPDPDDAEDSKSAKSIAGFTLIAATNRPGELPKAFRTRFLEFALEDYTEEELREICRRVSAGLGFKITGQAARLLAQNCNGSPRRIKKWVETVHLYFSGATEIDKPMVERFLAEAAGLDGNGLDANQRRYLRALHQHPDQVMTQEALVFSLGCDRQTVTTEVEPALFGRGYITTTSRGRKLTSSGAAAVADNVAVVDGGADEGGEE